MPPNMYRKKSIIVIVIHKVAVFLRPKEDSVFAPLLASNGVPPPPRVVLGPPVEVVDCDDGDGKTVCVTTAVSVMMSGEEVIVESSGLEVVGTVDRSSGSVSLDLVVLEARGTGGRPVSVIKPVTPPGSLDAVKVLPPMPRLVEDVTSPDVLDIEGVPPPFMTVTVAVTSIVSSCLANTLASSSDIGLNPFETSDAVDRAAVATKEIGEATARDVRVVLCATSDIEVDFHRHQRVEGYGPGEREEEEDQDNLLNFHEGGHAVYTDDLYRDGLELSFDGAMMREVGNRKKDQRLKEELDIVEPERSESGHPAPAPSELKSKTRY
ncbi:MAG: hypothetical protein M1816_001014 [Peltula sp. TS41687]|nr:MAG: hypothetical protein M1816_001014 [Peltula sp. TS41687]